VATGSRATAWRQGCALTRESSIALGLVSAADAASSLAIVISHDCDLIQPPEKEPWVEVIVSKRVGEANGSFTHAKNPRQLHLSCKTSGTDTFVELRACEKVTLKKEVLENYAPDTSIVMTANDKLVLQKWLGLRYDRSAFPDEFVKRLEEKGAAERLKKILEPHGQHLIAVFFDVDHGEEKERTGPADLYNLYVVVLYSTAEDPGAARTAAEIAAGAIRKLFRERYLDPAKGWQSIELDGCDAIADEGITYAQAARLKPWNMDYLSLRGDGSPGPMLS
jgi:hypothetical protein